MLEGSHIEDALTLRGFLAMLRRRKWIVLTTLVLVPSVAIGFSFQQPKLYQASAFGFAATVEAPRNPPIVRPVFGTRSSTRFAMADVRATPTWVCAIRSGC